MLELATVGYTAYRSPPVVGEGPRQPTEERERERIDGGEGGHGTYVEVWYDVLHVLGCLHACVMALPSSWFAGFWTWIWQVSGCELSFFLYSFRAEEAGRGGCSVLGRNVGRRGGRKGIKRMHAYTGISAWGGLLYLCIGVYMYFVLWHVSKCDRFMEAEMLHYCTWRRVLKAVPVCTKIEIRPGKESLASELGWTVRIEKLVLVERKGIACGLNRSLL